MNMRVIKRTGRMPIADGHTARCRHAAGATSPDQLDERRADEHQIDQSQADRGDGGQAHGLHCYPPEPNDSLALGRLR